MLAIGMASDNFRPRSALLSYNPKDQDQAASLGCVYIWERHKRLVAFLLITHYWGRFSGSLIFHFWFHDIKMLD